MTACALLSRHVCLVIVINLHQLYSHSQLSKSTAQTQNHLSRKSWWHPPIFLNYLSSQLSTTLAYLYQLFFDTTFMSPVWLTANITPIFKKRDAVLPSNYRPISLTCSLCKIMESIVKDQIVSYLITHGLLGKEQHAFIAKHLLLQTFCNGFTTGLSRYTIGSHKM